MHLPKHQEMIRNHARYGGLDEVMKVILEENKAAIHVESGEGETLSQRRFYHQPASSVPMKSCVHIHVPRGAATFAALQRASKGASAASNNSEESDAACALAADAA